MVDVCAKCEHYAPAAPGKPWKCWATRDELEACARAALRENAKLERLIVAATGDVATRKMVHKPGQPFPYWHKQEVFSGAWTRLTNETARIAKRKAAK